MLSTAEATMLSPLLCVLPLTPCDAAPVDVAEDAEGHPNFESRPTTVVRAFGIRALAAREAPATTRPVSATLAPSSLADDDELDELDDEEDEEENEAGRPQGNGAPSATRRVLAGGCLLVAPERWRRVLSLVSLASGTSMQPLPSDSSNDSMSSSPSARGERPPNCDHTLLRLPLPSAPARPLPGKEQAIRLDIARRWASTSAAAAAAAVERTCKPLDNSICEVFWSSFCGKRLP